MRLGVDSIENFRTGIIQTLHASRLPKVRRNSSISLHESITIIVLQYRILLNGFGYALFGVPASDLESVWRDDTVTPPGKSPLLGPRSIPTVAASTVTITSNY